MKNTFKNTMSYIMIILMALLLAVNYHFFIVENDFAPAGLNGIATIIQYKTGFSISYFSLIVNIPLCFVTYFLVSKRYGVRSIVFTLVYSGAYLLLQKIGLNEFKYDAGGHDTVFPVIISGVISGVVCGICFKNDSCSGGMELVSKYISKVRPETNFFKITFVINAIIAASSLFVYSQNGEYNYKPVALCIAYCFITNFVGDYIIKGSKTAYKFTVITTHPDEISQEVTHILRHGATRIEAQGVYTGSEKAVLICVINKHQLTDFKKIINKFDNTFSFYEVVNETLGNFKKIKREV